MKSKWYTSEKRDPSVLNLILKFRLYYVSTYVEYKIILEIRLIPLCICRGLASDTRSNKNFNADIIFISSIIISHSYDLHLSDEEDVCKVIYHHHYKLIIFFPPGMRTGTNLNSSYRIDRNQQ